MSSTTPSNHHIRRRMTGAENIKKVTECIEQAKKYGRENVSSSCEEHLKQYEEQEAAWSGASFADRALGTNANLYGYKNPYRVEKDYVDPQISNPNINIDPDPDKE